MAPVTTSTALVVELLADGGIRADHPGGRDRARLVAGDARLDRRGASRRRAPCTCAGELDAPPAVPVAEEVRRLATSLDEAPSQPAPWPKGRSSIQTAASNGLDRAGHRPARPWRLAERRARAADAVPPRHAARAHRRGGRAARCRSGAAPRPRAPGGASRRGRAPRLLAAVDVVAARAVRGARRGRRDRRRVRGRPGVRHHPAHRHRRGPPGARQHEVRLRRTPRRPPAGATLAGADRPAHPRRARLHAAGHRADARAVGARSARGRRPARRVREERLRRQSSVPRSPRSPGVRFVPLYAARGFLSPGFERLLARHVDRANVIVGPIAEERVGPGWKDRRP